MSVSIPRRLIQTAKSRDLDPISKAAAAGLKLLHPDWEYLFFDDAEVDRFVATEFPQYRAVYERFPHRIQRFDFFRYLAVLRHGGFYFDLDVFLSESVADLTASECVFPFEEFTLNSFLRQGCGIDWELGNYAFGAAPGHPFLSSVVENCVRAVTDGAWSKPLIHGVPFLLRTDFLVLNTTGPGIVTRTYAEQPELAVNVHVICPGDIFDERNWHRFGRYGVHLMQASWRRRRSLPWRAAARWCEQARRRRLLAQSHATGAMMRPLVAAS